MCNIWRRNISLLVFLGSVPVVFYIGHRKIAVTCKQKFILLDDNSACRKSRRNGRDNHGVVGHINNRAINSQEDIRHILLKARKLHWGFTTDKKVRFSFLDDPPSQNKWKKSSRVCTVFFRYGLRTDQEVISVSDKKQHWFPQLGLHNTQPGLKCVEEPNVWKI